jgi:hypothetical protein
LLSFAELHFVHPYGHIARQKDGKFNIEDLISAEPETQGKLLPFEIVKLILDGGSFNWRDEYNQEPVDVTIQPIDFESNEINTHLDSNSPVSISLAFESGTKLDWNGSLALHPLQSEGRIHIRNLQSRQFWELFLQNQAVTLNKGINELDTQYYIDYNGGQLHTKLESLQFAANGFVMT